MKTYYVANARLPNDKAHGIQIAKMCEAFREEGLDVVLVVPRRGRDKRSLQEFYNLRVPVPMIRLPAIDLYNGGPVGYRISSYFFMLVSVLFLLLRKYAGEEFQIYTVDLDNFSSAGLPLIGRPMYTEMHGGKPNTVSQRYLFAHVSGVIAINKLIVSEFKKTFPHSHARYLVEPNGVDESQFSVYTKQRAREHLGIAQEEKIVMYAGRFFAWKGLESLVEAARLTPELKWYVVGGTREYFVQVTGCTDLPANMVFPGSKPHDQMSWWLSSADALTVLGTKRDQQSYWYTSPMKLFEYLLSERPIIASATPAVREIVADTEVMLYEPDSAEDLAQKAQQVCAFPEASRERILRAQELGKQFSWQARAARIAHFINQ